eukprot:13103-Pyramimonas_sp.AAC.1
MSPSPFCLWVSASLSAWRYVLALVGEPWLGGATAAALWLACHNTPAVAVKMQKTTGRLASATSHELC